DRSKASVPSSRRSTTVRHTPFTAMEAPGPESSPTFGADTTSLRPGSTTRPSSSTIPVNTSLLSPATSPHRRLHLQVGPEAPNRTDLQPQRLRQGLHTLAPQDPGGGLAADDPRREIEHEAIDQALVDGRPRQRGATLDQHLLDAPFGSQTLHHLGQ